MIELNFLAFCITIIALTAITLGKDDIVAKSLSSLIKINESLIEHIAKLKTKRTK